jgi:hypothetical protein
MCPMALEEAIVDRHPAMQTPKKAIIATGTLWSSV